MNLFYRIIAIISLSLFMRLSANAANLSSDLVRLVGNWQSKNQEGIFEERWSKPIKNNMVGVARLVKHNGEAIFFN